jgi:hypothetical protein
VHKLFNQAAICVVELRVLPALPTRHPGGGKRGAATVDYTLPDRPADSAGWCMLEGKTAINDKNNFLGKAGSPLTFTIFDATSCTVEADGKCALDQSAAMPILWESEPVQYTETIQNFQVTLPETMTKLRLEVTASGSNACAHAVWLDPKLVAK